MDVVEQLHLAGVIVLGAREGRFGRRGEKKSMQPFAASSIPLVTLGTFLLWFGWFGFNGFSQLAMGTFDDVNAISKIAVNTHLAGAAGTFTGAALTRLIGGKTDIVMMLNGALAGLVAITAEPLTPGPITAMIHRIYWSNHNVFWNKNVRKLWFRRCSWCNTSSYVCRNFWNFSSSN